MHSFSITISFWPDHGIISIHFPFHPFFLFTQRNPTHSSIHYSFVIVEVMEATRLRDADCWLHNTISKEDREVTDVSDEICWICKTPGYSCFTPLKNRKLLLCDGPCGRAFHFRCLMLRVGLLVIIHEQKSDVGEGEWYCDDCLHHRPISESIYSKPKEDNVALLRTIRFIVSGGRGKRVAYLPFSIRCCAQGFGG